ncbi:MAG: hypothetical protein JSU93_07310 [Methanobacteriota archaeon]|nr:MAG: hypothetical protein JSU93_07310 [Euryarchaeota archaeon]
MMATLAGIPVKVRWAIGVAMAMSLLAPMIYVCNSSAEYEVGWDEPELAEDYDVASVSNPDSATDGNGDFVAVWIQYESPGSSICAAMYEKGQGWSDAELLEDSDEEPTAPQVAMNEAGNAIAAWAQINGSTDKRDVWSSRYVKGEGWLGPERVEVNSSAEDRVVAVAMDSVGNALVVWVRYEAAIDVMASRYEVGSGWGEPIVLDSSEQADSSFPSVAVDGNDDFTVVWCQWEMAQPAIWAKRYDAATGWEDAEMISDTGLLAQPRVIAGAGGDALCAWHHMDGTGFYEVWCCVYEAGVGWSPPAVMGSNPNTNHMDPRVAVDGDGNGAVVWGRSGGAEDGIYSRFYDVSSGWGENVTVSSDYYGDVYLPDIAMNSDGDALCIYARDGGDSDDLRGVVRNPEGGWLPSEQLTKEALGNIAGSQVVIGNDGNGIALWCQDDGSKISLWSARYLAPDETPPNVLIESPEDGATISLMTVAVSGQTEPGVYLVVNGIVVAVEEDGSFECTILLDEGENVITAVATDEASNSASTSVTVTYEVPGNTVQEELDDVKDQLEEAGESLDDAESRIDSLATQIMALMALTAVFVIVSIVMTALYLRLKNAMGSSGKDLEEQEVPPPPE